MLIAGPAATGKRDASRVISRLISLRISCTSQGMSDETAILAANAAYYGAFAAADIAAMSRVWADDNVSCIHPGWPALVGRPAILDSYREILRNPDQERIDPRNETVLAVGDEARVICVEFVGGAALASALPLAGCSGRPVLVAVLALIAVIANLSAIIRLFALSRSV